MHVLTFFPLFTFLASSHCRDRDGAMEKSLEKKAGDKQGRGWETREGDDTTISFGCGLHRLFYHLFLTSAMLTDQVLLNLNRINTAAFQQVN